MKSPELAQFKERLLALRARLRGEVSQMADSALRVDRSDLSSMPLHLADMGTDTYEQDFTLSLMERDEEALELIEAALERITEGTYGTCLECSTKIAKARLNALPYAPLCIDCASQLEKR